LEVLVLENGNNIKFIVVFGIYIRLLPNIVVSLPDASGYGIPLMNLL
jgi:hypothetical protein